MSCVVTINKVWIKFNDIPFAIASNLSTCCSSAKDTRLSFTRYIIRLSVSLLKSFESKSTDIVKYNATGIVSGHNYSMKCNPNICNDHIRRCIPYENIQHQFSSCAPKISNTLKRINKHWIALTLLGKLVVVEPAFIAVVKLRRSFVARMSLNRCFGLISKVCILIKSNTGRVTWWPLLLNAKWNMVVWSAIIP